MKKIVLSLLISVFLFFGLTHVYLNHIWPQERVLAAIEEQLSKQLKQQVSIANLSWTLWQGAKLNNLRIEGQNLNHQWQLDIDAVQINQNLYSLLQGMLKPSDILLYQPVLRIYPQNQTAHSTEQSLSDQPLTESWQQLIDKLSAQLPLFFQTGQVRILEGQVQTKLHAKALSAREQWNHIHGQIHFHLTNQTLQSQLKGQRSDNSFRLTLQWGFKDNSPLNIHYQEGAKTSLSLQASKQNSQVYVESLKWQWPGANLFISGNLDLADQYFKLSNVFSGQIPVKPSALQAYFPWTVLGPIESPFQLEGHWNQAIKTWHASGHVQSPEVQVSGQTLRSLNANYHFEDQALLIRPLAFLWKDHSFISTVRLDLNDPEPQWQVHSKIRQLDLQGLFDSFWNKRLSSINGPVNIALDQQFSLKGLKRLGSQGTLSSKALKIEQDSPLQQLIEQFTGLNLSKAPKGQELDIQFELPQGQEGLKVQKISLKGPNYQLNSKQSSPEQKNSITIIPQFEEPQGQNYTSVMNSFTINEDAFSRAFA